MPGLLTLGPSALGHREMRWEGSRGEGNEGLERCGAGQRMEEKAGQGGKQGPASVEDAQKGASRDP